MAYTIIKSDGTILTTIADGTINTTSTSLGLPSRNFSGYGKTLDTNFVHQLENFADSSPPPNPLRGQLWYNTNNQTMYVCPSDGETNASNWIALTSASSGGTTTFGSVTVQGNLQANIITAITSITASDGIFSNISVSGTMTGTNANIISANIGTVTTAAITTGANTTSGVLTGNWALSEGSSLAISYAENANIANIANVANTANIANTANTAATVTTNAQPNITSVGTLASLNIADTLNVSGNVGIVGNVGTTGIFAETLSLTGNANIGNLQTESIIYSNSITLTTPATGSIIKIWDQGGTGNAVIEFGRFDGVVSEPKFDFHSGNVATDYDSRIIASGGNGVEGSGNLSFIAANLNSQGQVNVDGNISATGNISANNVTSSSFNTQNTFGFKNRIINGGMGIDQRNNGVNVIPNSGQYSVDRWVCYLSQNDSYSIQQNAGGITPPVGYTNYLGITSLASYASLSSDFFGVVQNIEGLNIGDFAWGSSSARTVTLSFWARSSLTGTFGGSLSNSSFNRVYTFSYTISAANTWEYKTITIPGDTTGTWLTTNNIGMQCWFDLGSGSDFTGSAGSWSATPQYRPTGSQSLVGTNAATWYVTGVQIELGSIATSFDFRDYGRELMMCQRYFIRLINPPLRGAFGTTTTAQRMGCSLPVTMRILPVASLAGTTLAIYDGSATGTVNALGTQYNTPNSIEIDMATATGTFTVGRPAMIYNSGSGSVWLDAELAF